MRKIAIWIGFIYLYWVGAQKAAGKCRAECVQAEELNLPKNFTLERSCCGFSQPQQLCSEPCDRKCRQCGSWEYECGPHPTCCDRFCFPASRSCVSNLGCAKTLSDEDTVNLDDMCYLGGTPIACPVEVFKVVWIIPLESNNRTLKNNTASNETDLASEAELTLHPIDDPEQSWGFKLWPSYVLRGCLEQSNETDPKVITQKFQSLISQCEATLMSVYVCNADILFSQESGQQLVEEKCQKQHIVKKDPPTSKRSTHQDENFETAALTIDSRPRYAIRGLLATDELQVAIVRFQVGNYSRQIGFPFKADLGLEVTSEDDDDDNNHFYWLFLPFVVVLAMIFGLVYVYKRKRDKEEQLRDMEMANRDGGTDFLFPETLIKLRTVDMDTSNSLAWDEVAKFISVSETEIVFSSGSGQLIPITEAVVNTLTFTNVHKESLELKFILLEDEGRFRITPSQSELTLKKGESADVEFEIVLHCTMRLRTSYPIKFKYGSFTISMIAESALSTYLDFNEIRLGEKIGEGAFGNVFKGKWRSTSVAVKILKFSVNEDEALEVSKEISMLNQIRNKYIVNFVGACFQPLSTCILTEFISLGSLGDILAKPHKPISTTAKIRIALNTSEGMKFLHVSNILHRDLKPDNLLVVSLRSNAKINVKITDFGCSRTISEQATKTFTKGVGTPIYMAPEILRNEPPSKESDVYSFSILLWNLFTEKSPFEEFTHPWDVANHVVSGKRLVLEDGIPQTVQHLIQDGWQDDRTLRPTFAEISKILQKELASIKKNASSKSGMSFAITSAASSQMNSLTRSDEGDLVAPQVVGGEDKMPDDGPQNEGNIEENSGEEEQGRNEEEDVRNHEEEEEGDDEEETITMLEDHNAGLALMVEHVVSSVEKVEEEDTSTSMEGARNDGEGEKETKEVERGSQPSVIPSIRFGTTQSKSKSSSTRGNF